MQIKPPINTAREVIKIDIPNNIIFDKRNIFVFLIPYVIPIPRESILTEIARRI